MPAHLETRDSVRSPASGPNSCGPAATVSRLSADAGDDPVAPSTESIRTEWLLRVFAPLAYGFAVRNLAALWWADRSRLTCCCSCPARASRCCWCYWPDRRFAETQAGLHPIYLGYLVGHIGFLLVNFSWRNLIVLSVFFLVQVLRITREEAILATNSEDYRHCRERVRWRVIPFVY